MSNAKIVFGQHEIEFSTSEQKKPKYTFVFLSKCVCSLVVYYAVGLSFCMHRKLNENNIDVNKISNATCHGDEQDSPTVANKNIVYYR